MQFDTVEEFHGAKIQHGEMNRRVYLMDSGDGNPEELARELIPFAEERGYTKIFAKLPADKAGAFLEQGYRREAFIHAFYPDRRDALFLGYFLDKKRAQVKSVKKLDHNLHLAFEKKQFRIKLPKLDPETTIRLCTPEDTEEMAEVYKVVFPSYPFPVHQLEYLAKTMESHIDYFAAVYRGKIIALSSAEMEKSSASAEMTDFATLPDYRGQGLALHLLDQMEKAMPDRGINSLFTIARAASPGMNITFARAGYEYGGRLVNNTQISGSIESMNIWHKPASPVLPGELVHVTGEALEDPQPIKVTSGPLDEPKLAKV